MPYKDPEKVRLYQRLWQREKRANAPSNNGGQIGALERQYEGLKLKYEGLRGPPRYLNYGDFEAQEAEAAYKILETKLEWARSRADQLETLIEKWSDGGPLRERQKLDFQEGRDGAMRMVVDPDTIRRQIGEAQLKHFDEETARTVHVVERMKVELSELRGK
jgi:hypothetical protein